MKDRRAAPAAEPRHLARSAVRDDASVAGTGRAEAGDDPAPAAIDRVDLSGLSVAGITRRRVGWVAAGLLAAWIVVVFARQVGEATAAANRADQLAVDNAALAAEVEALAAEVELIVRAEYVAQAARGQRFGTGREIAFTLDPSMPGPVDGAPGSASVRLGVEVQRQTPLESWLALLFGPGG